MFLFLNYLSLFFLLITICYFIGEIYLNLFFHEKYKGLKGHYFQRFSFSSIIGYILFVSILAVVFTSFKTIFLGVFIVFLLPIFYLKKENVKNVFKKIKIPNRKFFFILLLISSIVFSYNCIIFYRNDGFYFFDLLFYSKISQGIYQYGLENPLVMYFDFSKPSKLVIYHYNDLWASGFLSKLSNNSFLFTLVYVIYAYLHFILLILVIAFSRSFIKFKPILTAVFLLYGLKLFYTCSFNNEVLDQIKRYRGFPDHNLFSKLTIVYILVIFGVYLYKLNFQKFAFIILAFTPIFYTTTLPALFGISIALVTVSIFFQKNKINGWNLYYKYPIYIVFSICYIFVLLYFLSDSSQTNMPLKVYSIKTYLVFFIETMIKVFGEYILLLILLIYVLLKTKFKFLTNTVVVFSLSGILAGFAFIYIHAPGIIDIDQSLNNVSPVLLLILGFEIMIKLENKLNIVVILLLFACSINNLTYFYFNPTKFGYRKDSQSLSSEFCKNVKYCFKKNKIKNTFTIKEGDYYATQRWNYDLHSKFQDLYKYNDIKFPLDIGFLFQKFKYEQFKNHPYFKRFKDKNVSLKRILKFFYLMNVEYVFIENKKELPTEFLSNFNCLFEDKLTGGGFWKIKKGNEK